MASKSYMREEEREDLAEKITDKREREWFVIVRLYHRVKTLTV